MHRLTDTEAAVDTIVQGARNGAACVWVRNAVDDAIGAVEMLRDQGVGADLLHARFTVADRLHKVLDAGAWVYSQDVQWRTARVLFDAGAIRAPEGLRDLIEAVHGDVPVVVPVPLENASQQYQGRMIGERQQASNNLLVADAPYDQTRMQQVWDDERFPTRLGDAQITLRLARFRDGGLLPWAAVAGGDWQMSEVQVSAARLRKFASVDHEGPEIREVKKGWPNWKKAQVAIAPVAQNGRICEGVRYDSELGLHFIVT